MNCCHSNARIGSPLPIGLTERLMNKQYIKIENRYLIKYYTSDIGTFKYTREYFVKVNTNTFMNETRNYF